MEAGQEESVGRRDSSLDVCPGFFLGGLAHDIHDVGCLNWFVSSLCFLPFSSIPSSLFIWFYAHRMTWAAFIYLSVSTWGSSCRSGSHRH